VIRVEKSGYRPYEETIQVAAADRRVIAAELAKMIETAARGMVRVPAGEFFSGCNEKVDSECDEDEKPGKKRYVAAFSIDATEVTVEAYRECVERGACSSRGLEMPFYDGQEQPGGASFCNWNQLGRERHPVNCVNWSQATSFCSWKGKRLPTEWEWEKAARGTDGRKYPWGNEQVSCRQAVIRQGGTACGRGNTTFQVASKPLGVSPYGAHDMIGNVSEWTSSQYSPGSSRRVVRGGSWLDPPRDARASYRLRLDPGNRYNFIGFRCAQ
jgi:formylglycine-generating enzyme required for sulfatase activity